MVYCRKVGDCMVYRSKIGFGWSSALLGVTLGVAYTTMTFFTSSFDDLHSIFLVFIYISFFIMVDITWRTKYTLQQECLDIRMGILSHETIAYQDIIEYKETRNPMSSAALSIDRISITYNKEKYGSCEILISPESKEQFIKDLQWRIEQSIL